MASLPESASAWVTGTYQIETTDSVIGGTTGIANIQGTSLGNRTAFLYAKLKDASLNYAADTGTANAYVANVPAAPTAWVDGSEYRFRAANANTAVSTFTPNNASGGLTPVTIYAGDNAATQGGEIAANSNVTVRFIQALNSGAGGVVIMRATGGVMRSGTPPVGDASTAVATMAAVFTSSDGMASVNVASATDVTLTKTQYGNAMLSLTGTPTAAFNLIFPAQTGQWVVVNSQGGTLNITAKTSAGGSVGVVIPQGVAVVLYSDGTNMGLASASGTASFRRVPITGVTGTTLTISGGYTPGITLIEKNGTFLSRTSDFTDTNGTTIAVTTAAVSTDKYNVYVFASFSVANALTLAGGAMSGAIALAGGDTIANDPAAADNSTKLPSTKWVNANSQSQAGTAFTTAGTAPAFTLTPTPALTALAANQRFRVKFNAAGTTGSNTLNISGLGAVAIKQYGQGGVLVPAVVSSGLLADIEYDGTEMVILDPVMNGVLNYKSLTASGNFTTPANITTSTVFEFTLVGGGAGGGGANASNVAAGGGGAGGCASFELSGLSPSTSYAVLIGAAGAGGTGSSNGGTGGTTQITIGATVYSVAGGVAGVGTTTAQVNVTSGQGGASASITALASYNPVFHTTGAIGWAMTPLFGGNNGGGLPFGTNGVGAYTGAGATAALGYGCGGGGGVATLAGSGGSPGLFIAKWVA